MKITQTRVKQYNSTYKTVISVDGGSCMYYTKQ